MPSAIWTSRPSPLAGVGCSAEVVFWNERSSRSLLNAITIDWLRCDLSVVGPDALTGKAQDRLRPLIDKDGLHAALPELLPPKRLGGGRVLGIVNEFIRVLGLHTAAAGREEYYLGVTEATLLRDRLVKPMLQEDPNPIRAEPCT